jgi:exodeoxyribonuclease VII small subunit
MTTANLTYEQAYEELSTIAKALENETISVDELAEKVKRAAELVAYCKSKLQAAETQVKDIISGIDKAE